MNKGVVLEKHNHFMIVMTNDGQFVKAKLDDEVDVGQETSYYPIRAKNWLGIWKEKHFLPAIAAAVMLIFLLPVLQLFSDERVYGFVTVDINPSIELQLNKDYEVIGAKGYNEDGEKMVLQLEEKVLGQPLNVVVDQLITKGNELGYLSNERDIYISSSLNLTEELWGESYDLWMHTIQEKYEVNFFTISVDEETIEEAKKLSISPTKYVFFQNDREKGIDIDVEQINNTSIEKIEINTGNSLNKIVDPERIKVNAPFERGRPENPGNSNSNRDKNKSTSPGSNNGKGIGNDDNIDNPGKGNQGNDNPGKGNSSKDDQHPSVKKSENNSQNNRADHPPSSGKENNKNNLKQENNARQNRENNVKENPSNNVRQNQGNNARQNQGNQVRQNQGNGPSNHPKRDFHPRMRP